MKMDRVLRCASMLAPFKDKRQEDLLITDATIDVKGNGKGDEKKNCEEDRLFLWWIGL